MEYLPNDPFKEEQMSREKTEKKLKSFREYIVDKGIVLALVKVLLSLKYSEDKPKNPMKAIREFFGKYKDPKWDEVAALQEEIILLSTQNQKLFEKVQNLEAALIIAKRDKRILKLFESYELDKNKNVGTKQIIEKLSGNKKFEVEEKLGLSEYTKLIENASIGASEDFLLSKLEESVGGVISFKDDLENEVYKQLLLVIKDLKKVTKK